MKIKTVNRKVVEEETFVEVQEVNKYFWHSRSVYAVEFKFDIYKDIEGITDVNNQMCLLEVQFENNIIKSKNITYSEKYPFTTSPFYEVWVKDLLSQFIKETEYNERTKEQFYADFNIVIENLKALSNEQPKI